MNNESSVSALNHNVAWQRAGALFAGIFVGAVLSFGADALMRYLKIYSPFGQPMGDKGFLMAISYRTLFNILGCYVAARLAPDRPMWHVMGLGTFMFAVSLLAAIVTWSRGPEFGPHWYAVANVVVAFPCAWLGGALYTLKATHK